MGIFHRRELKIFKLGLFKLSLLKLEGFKLSKLNQIISNLPLNRWQIINRHENSNQEKPGQKNRCQKRSWRTDTFSARRKEFVHFCEHDGIYIHFTKARSTWHALAPCALKPWWLFLRPLKKNMHKTLHTN